MKFRYAAVLMIGMAGCKPHEQPVRAAKQPCEPSVTDQMARHPAAIVAKSVERHDLSWSELHRTACGEKESDVLPSQRMYSYAYDHFGDTDGRDKWLAEHTYCIPDGMTP